MICPCCSTTPLPLPLSRDDYLLLSCFFSYLVSVVIDPMLSDSLPVFNGPGLLIVFLMHIGPVEYLYYWLHRALHHHYLYTRYHSHHHASFVTEAVTGVCESV